MEPLYGAKSLPSFFEDGGETLGYTIIEDVTEKYQLIKGCCTHIRLEGKYKIKYTGDHLVQVYADQFKIDQVLINLVNNAVICA